jgi:hypothetical protein
VYLSFARKDGVAGDGDVEGDVVGGGDAKSSMSGGGRARSSRQRIRWDIASPVLDGRRPVMEVCSSHAKGRFLKTLFVLSWCRIARTKVLEIYSPDCWCTQEIGMERLWRQRSNEKRKILIDYLRIFELKLPIVVFGVCFSGGLVHIYLHIN